uniref:ARID DNA-binding domain-containing protein n=1 Tax=Tanacetum cinerariifolium TaxID=118510 RepID=A0A6L2P1H8_TANCI|nr:ARID DNA-binding domain-containing protein [Tanacetum cinerariifolium]
MVNSNTIVEDHWNSSKPSTNRKPIWYQSNNLGNTFRGKEQSDFLFRKEKKEKEQELGTKIKQITESCKNMLRKKIEEIKTYNSSIHRPFIKTYRMAGDAKAVAEKEASEPVNINPNIFPTPTVSLDYLESIYLKTKCMIKGIDLDHWDNIWDEIISKDWDTFRKRFDKVVIWFYEKYLKLPTPGPIPPNINRKEIYLFDPYKLVEGLGGYLSVHFERQFGTIGEILGLPKEEKEQVKACYVKYLDVFTSYFKTARVSHQDTCPIRGIPTQDVEEDDGHLRSPQNGFEEKIAPNIQTADMKNKGKLEHFGITL